MGRDATKAAGNPWYQARKKAAEYDDRLCSRESAAEQLGMSVSSLADAELGNTKFMPVDKAVLMADRYNAPWLLNHYCLNECPIGCRHSLSDEVVGIDRVTVKLLKSLKTEQLGEVKDTLLDIAADGKITEDEKPALQEVLTYLDDLAKTVSELKTIGEMALNEVGDAHGSKYGGISKRTLENAAIKGSAVHNSIENWIKFGIDDIPSEHRGYFNGFMEWWKQYKPRVFGSEVRIYHKLMRYGGTIDLLCEIGGLLELIDFKTTYTLLEMACGVQLEAYSQALISHGITPQRKHILHLKKDGKWAFREFPAKDPARCRVVGALKCLYDYEQSYK